MYNGSVCFPNEFFLILRLTIIWQSYSHNLICRRKSTPRTTSSGRWTRSWCSPTSRGRRSSSWTQISTTRRSPSSLEKGRLFWFFSYQSLKTMFRLVTWYILVGLCILCTSCKKTFLLIRHPFWVSGECLKRFVTYIVTGSSIVGKGLSIFDDTSKVCSKVCKCLIFTQNKSIGWAQEVVYMFHNCKISLL